MSDNSAEMARAFLRKASNDLRTAEQTLLLADGPTDTVCFHAQQAAEKALKALLTHNKTEFPKIHDLVRLLDLALPLAPNLDFYRERLAGLSAYAVEARYPEDFYEPSREEAEWALAVAKALMADTEKEIAKKNGSRPEAP